MSANQADDDAPWPRRLAAVVGSALVLMFFSEFFFVNEGPILRDLAAWSPAGLLALLEFAAFYALFAYLFLLVLWRYDVRGWNGLLLAGALFGWATESLIVPVAYEAVPVSLIFPSVGWHALVDVLVGWYLVRAAMRLDRPLWSALTFATVGAAWGAWGTWFASDEALAPLTPGEFRRFAGITAASWIAGMILLDRVGTGAFRPGKWEARVVLAVTALLLVAMALPYLPASLALPPLVAAALWALRRRRDRPGRDLLRRLRLRRPAWWNYPLALLTPCVAALVYPGFYHGHLVLPAELVTFLLLVVGAAWLVVALVLPAFPAFPARRPQLPGYLGARR